MDVDVMNGHAEAPRIKTPSPQAVKKTMGVHAAQVLEVLDNHADCLEWLTAQVLKLTVLPDHHSAQINALLDGMAEVTRMQQRQAMEASTFWRRLRWLVRGH